MKRIILSRNFEQRGLFKNIITDMQPTLKEKYVANMNVSGNNRDILLNNNWYTIGEDTILIDIPESSLLRIPIESLLGIYDEPTYILAHSKNIEGRSAAEMGVFEEYKNKAVYYFNHLNDEIVCVYNMNQLPSDYFENVFDALFITAPYMNNPNRVEDWTPLIERLKSLTNIQADLNELYNSVGTDDFMELLSNLFIILADEYTIPTDNN